MQTMMASTPVNGPSNPKARSVRPPAVRVRRVREGENSSKIMRAAPRGHRSCRRLNVLARSGQIKPPMMGASQRLKVVTGLPVAPSTQKSTN